MANFKYNRISEQIKVLINQLINEEIDDLDFVTVTEVEITKDLADAKIYVMAMNDSSEKYVIDTLTKKKGFLKSQVAKKLNLRRTPNLIFKYDHSLGNYNRIDELLK